VYYGLECPMGNVVHCQCHDDSDLGEAKGDEYCEGAGSPLVHAHGHCVGPYTAGGYRFGDYAVGSVYLTTPENAAAPVEETPKVQIFDSFDKENAKVQVVDSLEWFHKEAMTASAGWTECVKTFCKDIK
jgi:hypothetical protein